MNRVKIAFINSSASWVDDIYEFVTRDSENWLYATDTCKSDSSDKNETFPFSLSICRVSFCCSTVESLWLRYLLMNSLPGSKRRVFLFVACTERKLLLVKLLRKLMSRTVKLKWYLICAVSERTEHIQHIKNRCVLPPALAFVMSLKERSFLVSPGTVLSILCLLLCSVGFIRIETIFKDYEQRLKTVEKVLPHDQMKRARTNLASTNEGNWKHSVLYNISFHINFS